MVLAATLVGLPGVALAQESATVHAVRALKVLAQPDASAAAVGDVNAGEILEVLDTRDGWHLVRPPQGSERTWRTGWVERSGVRTLAAAPPATTLRGSAREEGQASAMRAAEAGTLTEAEDRAIRKRALTVGLIGAGIAVTGLVMQQSGDGSNLPGASSTQDTIGFALMGVGGYWAATGLWRAFR
jgi:hypothetical protein